MARFIASLRYDDIPEAARHRIKLLILDAVGCALYARDLQWSRILRDTLLEVDSSRQCAVWGTAARLSSVHAALCNGTQVQGFELDDVHREGVVHVGAVALPPIIAVAETRQGMSGKELLAAAVAGYEIGPRVGMCMAPYHLEQGWHAGATVGVFSAAAGAARALRLSEEQTVHAIGVAGTQASGLMAAQFGSMVKRMHAGRAAQSGLYAALLAERGFTGIVDVFEAKYGGFCTTFSASRDHFDLERLTRGLGEDFEVMRVSLKLYSCVASNHTTLDAIRALQAERPFGPDDVDRIIVHGSRATVEHVGWKYRPEGVTASQLNLPFCVATLLLEGDCFVEQFSEAAVSDARRMALATRVECVEDEAITALGADMRHMVRVEVCLKDGSVLHATVQKAQGSEDRFPSDDVIVGKFRKLAAKALSEEQAARLAETVLNLEKLADARELARLLVPSG